ncbi:MAG TPA: hypothetical protein VMB03_26565 [Bryobacteraceae bacterium]|nr:hypothetical protein [Bryobacteraceae bacterium]
MKSSGAILAERQEYLLLVCVLGALLPLACQKAKPRSEEPVTSVFIDKTAVKLGDEIRIQPTRPLANWTGEATINTYRARLAIDSRNNAIRVTRDNGFSTISPSEVCVALKDAKGKDLRVVNECVRIDVSTTLFHLEPENQTVSSTGGEGRVRVDAPTEAEWEFGPAPDWIAVEKEKRDAGFDPDLRYKVAVNTSYKSRSTAIPVGDAKFVITQAGSPYVAIPYSADFTQPPIPVWEMPANNLRDGDSHDQPPRWVLDDQVGQHATVQSSHEGPSGSPGLMLERPQPPDEPWKTLVWLPGLITEAGSRYRISVWLKAQAPAQVGLELGQRTDPHDGCGLFQLLDVPSDWKQFTVDFKAAGKGCGSDNNRLAFHAGRVSGKLWISGLTVSRQ